MSVTNAQKHIFDPSKQIKTIEKAVIVNTINLFRPK